jgi:hypothetical protein
LSSNILGEAMRRWTPRPFERDLRGKIDRAKTAEQLNAAWFWAKAHDPLTCTIDNMPP